MPSRWMEKLAHIVAHLDLYVVGNSSTKSKFRAEPATWVASKVRFQTLLLSKLCFEVSVVS